METVKSRSEVLSKAPPVMHPKFNLGEKLWFVRKDTGIRRGILGQIHLHIDEKTGECELHYDIMPDYAKLNEFGERIGALLQEIKIEFMGGNELAEVLEDFFLEVVNSSNHPKSRQLRALKKEANEWMTAQMELAKCHKEHQIFHDYEEAQRYLQTI